MGVVLLMAADKQIYTLTDMGTFLSYQGEIDLVPIVDSGAILLNVYSVIVTINGDNAEMAANLVAFLTSPDIQELIGKYGVEEYGLALFTPLRR